MATSTYFVPKDWAEDSERCPDCGGAGRDDRITAGACLRCSGRGWISKTGFAHMPSTVWIPSTPIEIAPSTDDLLRALTERVDQLERRVAELERAASAREK